VPVLLNPVTAASMPLDLRTGGKGRSGKKLDQGFGCVSVARIRRDSSRKAYVALNSDGTARQDLRRGKNLISGSRK